MIGSRANQLTSKIPIIIRASATDATADTPVNVTWRSDGVATGDGLTFATSILLKNNGTNTVRVRFRKADSTSTSYGTIAANGTLSVEGEFYDIFLWCTTAETATVELYCSFNKFK